MKHLVLGSDRMRCAILLFFVTVVSSREVYFEDHEYSRTPLGDRIDKASVKMLKDAYLASEESNVVTSPLGVLLLLSLYSSGALNENRDEIMTFLGSSDHKERTAGSNFVLDLRNLDYEFDSYTSLGNKFSSMDSSYMTFANKVYVAKEYTLADNFLDIVRSYRNEVDSINFRDNKAAAAIINKWAAEKTKGHITSPVSEETLRGNPAAALFNVIFFQGHWNVPFKAEETKDKDFHVNKSIAVKKPMMHLKDSLNYYEDNEIEARMIELPYREPGFRMVVVLPNEVDGLASVLDKVSKKGLLEDVFALSPSEREINLLMPKFDINSKLDYTSILPKLGVKRMFSEGASGIVKERSVAVSKLFQEAIVKVDEEGATAGAFTGALLMPISGFFVPPKPIDFIVDHPFLFAILH